MSDKIGSAYVEIEAKSNVKPGIAQAQQEVEQAAAQQTLTFEMGGAKSMAGPSRAASADVGKSLDLIRQKLGSAWDAPGADRQSMIMKQFEGTKVGFGQIYDIMQEQKRREAAASEATKAEAEASKAAAAGLKNLEKESKKATTGFGKLAERMGTTFGFGMVAGGASIGLAATMSRFAGRASPAAQWRFEQAGGDLQGAIGRSIMPEFEHTTNRMRNIADTLVNLGITNRDAPKPGETSYKTDAMMGAGAFVIAARFLGLAGGPVGWGLTGAATAVGIGVASDIGSSKNPGSSVGIGGFKGMGQVYGGPEELWLAAAQAALSQPPPLDRAAEKLEKAADVITNVFGQSTDRPGSAAAAWQDVKAFFGAQ